MITKLVRSLDYRIRIVICIIILIVMNYIVSIIDTKMEETVGNYEPACINGEITHINNTDDFCSIRVQLETGKNVDVNVNEANFKVGENIKIYTDNKNYSLSKSEVAEIHTGAVKYWNIKVIVILIAVFVIYDFLDDIALTFILMTASEFLWKLVIK